MSYSLHLPSVVCALLLSSSQLNKALCVQSSRRSFIVIPTSAHLTSPQPQLYTIEMDCYLLLLTTDHSVSVPPLLLHKPRSSSSTSAYHIPINTASTARANYNHPDLTIITPTPIRTIQSGDADQVRPLNDVNITALVIMTDREDDQSINPRTLRQIARQVNRGRVSQSSISSPTHHIPSYYCTSSPSSPPVSVWACQEEDP